MKKWFMYLAMLTLITGNNYVSAQSAGSEKSTGDPVRIVFSPELQKLTETSLSAFSEINPAIPLKGTAIDIQPHEAWLKDETDLAVVSEDFLRGVKPSDVEITVLGRDVYVPVMNPANPCLERIRETGVAPIEFAAAFTSGGNVTWGNLADNECREIVNAYRTDNKAFLSYLADFTGNDPAEIGGQVETGCKMVMEAVRSDKLAIGFCKLDQLMNLQRSGEAVGVVMIPVDKNENNTVDHFENIYGNVDALARGVWIGKYPTALCSKIYAVTKKGLQQNDVDAFLLWLATDGQKVLASMGYTGLLENEQATFLASVDADAPVITPEEEKAENPLLLILGMLALAIILGFYGFRLLNGRMKLKEQHDVQPYSMGPKTAEHAPGGYFIDKSHTWAFMEQSGNVRVGIDNFLQHITGTITRMGLKKPGEKVKKGEVLLRLIQHGKTMELRSPVSGTIFGTNNLLEKDASPAGSDPYNEGWIYLIEPSNWEVEAASFVRGDSHAKWIKEEIVRLKDFFAEKLQGFFSNSTQPVMQEGGELSPGLMEQLGPEAWEEFQTGFLYK